MSFIPLEGELFCAGHAHGTHGLIIRTLLACVTTCKPASPHRNDLTQEKAGEEEEERSRAKRVSMVMHLQIVSKVVPSEGKMTKIPETSTESK